MTAPGKTRRREQALAALIQTPTIAQAATVTGVGERTLRRWLKQPTFAAEYRMARRQIVEQAAGAVQELMGEAVTALRRNLTAPAPPAAQVRAAGAVIDLGLRAVEFFDLAERVASLEKEIGE